VTAQKIDEVHDVLKASRAQARALTEGSVDGIFVADLNGTFTDVNAAGSQMLNWSREEIIGKTIVDLIPAKDIGRLVEVKSRLFEGFTEAAEWYLRKRDGTLLPVEASTKIFADGRWQVVARDITRKREEGRPQPHVVGGKQIEELLFRER
jgi:PAS domain S-box-containing protein